MIDKALGGTTSILESALKYGTQLRSVVYMSSGATITEKEAKVYSEKDWNTTAQVIFKERGNETGPLMAYTASKVAAEKAFWEFKEQRKPVFTMTAIQAS